MPMLPFFPWATISEPVRFGDFHLVPLGGAINEGLVPATMVDPVMAILAAYGKTRQVDALSIPLLRREGVTALANLTEEQIADYFGFRLRLTFAALSTRRFFGHRYLNSDNLRLVIQGFEQDRAGGAMIQSRRRDGSATDIIPKGHLTVRRPNHISGGCELPRDLDVPLLQAMEKVRDADADLVERLDDVVRLFVGANTDSPDVSEHSELVDLVSAFGRLVGEWKEPETVRAFVKLLPGPDADMRSPALGTRAANPRLIEATANKPVRAAWLKDAFLLRHSYGHGRVTTPSHAPIWSQREHLLLGAVALPLAFKAVLQEAGAYTFTRQDESLNLAFDDLTLVEPFAPVPDDDDHWRSPWRHVLADADTRQIIRELAGALAQERATSDAAQDEKTLAGNHSADATKDESAPSLTAPGSAAAAERDAGGCGDISSDDGQNPSVDREEADLNAPDSLRIRHGRNLGRP